MTPSDDLSGERTADVELDRLQRLEGFIHTWTVETLSVIGDLAGKRCLELGAGAGTTARWLSEQVGPAGSVTAVDTDARFLTNLPANVDVIEVDLEHFYPEGMFDIVHCRAALADVPGLDVVLSRISARLALDGWLVCEEELIGLDVMEVAEFPLQLPVRFHGLGLSDVEARVNGEVSKDGLLSPVFVSARGRRTR